MADIKKIFYILYTFNQDLYIIFKSGGAMDILNSLLVRTIIDYSRLKNGQKYEIHADGSEYITESNTVSKDCLIFIIASSTNGGKTTLGYYNLYKSRFDKFYVFTEDFFNHSYVNSADKEKLRNTHIQSSRGDNLVIEKLLSTLSELRECSILLDPIAERLDKITIRKLLQLCKNNNLRIVITTTCVRVF